MVRSRHSEVLPTNLSRKNGHALAVCRRPRDGVGLKCGEVIGAQKLLRNVHSVKRRVRGQIFDGSIIVFESYESSIFHASPFSSRHWPQHTFRQFPGHRKGDAVIAFGDHSKVVHGGVSIAKRVVVVHDAKENIVQFLHRERGAQLIQYVPRILPYFVQLIQQPPKICLLQEWFPMRTNHRMFTGWVNGDIAHVRHDSTAKSNG